MSKNYIEQPRFGCALASQQTVVAIPGARPILHAGPGCSGKAYDFASLGAGFQGDNYAGGSHISCTNASEEDVVFGGEKKLRNTIDGALQVIKGDLFVVLSGCTSDIVGDNSIGVAKSFAEQGKPVVGTETAGFKGTSYYGHLRVIEAIIEQFIGDVKPNVEKGLVNVFSVVPYQDPFWRGDLREIKELLEGIGLKVNILFGVGSEGVKEWKNIPNAEFNLLLSPWVGIETVELLEKKYGTPYLHIPVLPVGPIATGEFLRKVGEYAKIEAEKVEKVIKEGEKWFYDYFITLADFIAEFRNNLPAELYTVADSSYALGVTNFLINELGFIPKGTYLIDDPKDKYKEQIEQAFNEIAETVKGTLVFEPDGGLVQEDIRKRLGNSHRALILGSNWEKYLAQETRNQHGFLSLPINEAVITDETIVGYRGGVHLLSEVYNSIFKRGDATSRTQINID